MGVKHWLLGIYRLKFETGMNRDDLKVILIASSEFLKNFMVNCSLV